MFSTILVITRTIVNCSSLESGKFQRSFVVPLLQSVVLVHLRIIFETVIKVLWLDLGVKAYANQLYRAIFTNRKDMVSCWKSVVVKKSKNDLAVSKVP